MTITIKHVTCPYCMGRARRLMPEGYVFCEPCDGTGSLVACPTCGGEIDLPGGGYCDDCDGGGADDAA